MHIANSTVLVMFVKTPLFFPCLNCNLEIFNQSYQKPKLLYAKTKSKSLHMLLSLILFQ